MNMSMEVTSMTEKELLKSEKIRIKNDQLRAQGKDPAKGWGKMVNTKFGGGGASGSTKGNSLAFDKMGASVEGQKSHH